MSAKLKQYGRILVLTVVLLTLAVCLLVATWTTAQSDDAITSNPETNSTSNRFTQNFVEDIAARSKNRRVWFNSLTGSKVVEVGSGICHRDAQGKWQITDAYWQATSDGFVMNNAGYQLQIGSTLGSWLTYTIDGNPMRLRPASLKADDDISSVILAEANQSVHGEIDPQDPRRLIFSEAFGPETDLVLQVGPAGFHQDVIFHQPPSLPNHLDAKKCQISIHTELDLEPSVAGEAMMVSLDETTLLDLQEPLHTPPTKDNIYFVNIRQKGDYDFTESPRHHFAASKVYDTNLRQTSAHKRLSRSEQGKTTLIETLDNRFFQTAHYPVRWDYQAVSGSWDPNETFNADTTYYLTSDITIDNGELWIEPGTTIKFDPNVSLSVEANGAIIAQGKPYLPIVFTSVHDDTHGETITGVSTGNPARGDYVGLTIAEGSQVEFCRILYAQTGLQASSLPDLPLQHNRITSCTKAISIHTDPNSLGTNTTLDLFNNLIVDCNTAIVIGGSAATIDIQNHTFDNHEKAVVIDPNCTSTITIENSLFSNSANGIFSDSTNGDPALSFNGFYNNTTDFTDITNEGPNNVDLTASPYHSGTFIAMGTYYLNQDASGGELLKDAGKISITASDYLDGNLWSIYHVANDGLYGFDANTVITTDTTWQPNVVVCDSGLVAIGYHHPRIDFLIDGATVAIDGSSGIATLTIEPGTVVAHHTIETNDTLSIEDNGSLICQGDVYGEGGITWVASHLASQLGTSQTTGNFAIVGESGSDYTIDTTRFLGLDTALYLTQNSGTVRDCLFQINETGIVYDNCSSGSTCQNSLFVGNDTGIANESTSNLGPVENCTFSDNNIGIYSDSGSLTLRNSLFSNNTVSLAKVSTATITESYNAFYSNDPNVVFSEFGNLATSDWADPNRANAQGLAGNPFDQNWLDFSDRFYLAQNSPVVGNGYDPASLGMAGYTTRLDKASHDDPNIDIGYHSLMDSRIDTDGDGLYNHEEFWNNSDYTLIDTDGDGLVDGEDGFVLLRDYPDGIDKDGDGYVDGELTAGTNPANADSDSDQIPDGWEYLYANTNPNSADASGDIDNDGLTNLQEYQNGLDPDVNNEGDSWTSLEYDGDHVTRQIVYELRDGIINALSETRNEYDSLDRQFRQRRLIAPTGTLDDANDLIQITLYNIDSSINQTALKGAGSTDPDTINGTLDITTSYSYDPVGRQTQITDTLGNITSYTFVAASLIDTFTDPNANIISYNYDNAGRLKKIIDAENHYQVKTYNSRNRVIKEVAYDKNNNALRQVRYEYNAINALSRWAVMSDAAEPNGISTTRDQVIDTIYDPNTGSFPGLLTSQKIYYGGNPAQTATTSYEYDTLDRRNLTTDPLSNETHLVYNKSGQRTRIQQIENHPDAGGTDLTITTDFAFDSHGRLIQSVQKPANPDAQSDSSWLTTDYEVDGLNRRVSATNPKGVVTDSTFDGLGRQTKTIADSGSGKINQTTEVGFNRLGWRTSMSGYQDNADPNTQQITLYAYNKNQQVVKIEYPDASTILYQYNAIGKVSQRTDQREIITTYLYDGGNRLLTKNVFEIIGYYDCTPCDPNDPNLPCDPDCDTELIGDPLYSVDPNIVETLTYDGLGRLLSAERNVYGTVVSSSGFAYNGIGLLSSEATTLFDANEVSIGYAYDQAGYLTSRTHDGANETVNYTRDGRGRIGILSRDNGLDSEYDVANYRYIGSQVESINFDDPNLIYETVYNNLGQITDIDNHPQDPNENLELRYSYGDAGNRKQLQYNHLPTVLYDKYTFDNLNRLTFVDYGATSGWSMNLLDNPFLPESFWQMQGMEQVVAASESWLSDFDDHLPYQLVDMVTLAEQWMAFDVPVVETTLRRPVLAKENREDFDKLFDQTLSQTEHEALVNQLFDADVHVIYAVVVEDSGETSEITVDESGWTTEIVRDVNGTLLRWEIYTQKGNGKKEYMAEIYFDKQERITLFRLYPDIGGTVEIVITYDANGEILTETANEYDSKGNLVSTQDMLAPQPTTSESLSMSSFSLLGGGGESMAMGEPGSPSSEDVTFNYDDLGNRDSVVTNYGFGLMSTDTYTTNGFNQYTEIEYDDPNNIGYLDYDDAGNTTQDGLGYIHYYDEENRLVEIADPNNNTLLEFEYDALGRRIKQFDVDSNCTIYFYHDKMGRIISEYLQEGTGSIDLVRSYVWGNGFDEILGMFNPGTAASGDPNDMDILAGFVDTWLLDPNDGSYDDTYDDPNDDFIDYRDFANTVAGVWTYSPAQPEKRWYYMKDALGSVMGIVGSHPNASSEFYLYDVYGLPNGTSAIGNPFYYAGKRNVIYGGSHFLGDNVNRYLNFYTGRWMSIDPLGVNPNGGMGNGRFDPRIQTTDGANLYEYVQSNPITNVDPMGLFGKCGPGFLGGLIIPDNPWWVIGSDFTDACKCHDKCYGGQGCLSRRDCDSNFLGRMYRACRNKYTSAKGRRQCFKIASIYYKAVRKGGRKSYKPQSGRCCSKPCRLPGEKPYRPYSIP